MTIKQETFCRIYAATKNATQSAIQAGYSEKTAYSTGNKLLKKGEIQKKIKELIDEQCNGLPDKTEIKEFWSELMRDPTQKASIRLTASTNLAKALFMFNSDIAGWDD